MFTRLLMAVALVAAVGCSSIQMERGEKGTPEYEKITVRAPPKDWTGLDFKWGETRLKAGDAVTAEQPWAEVFSEISESSMLNMLAYCTAYPVLCEGDK
jgi:hypothetical protein